MSQADLDALVSTLQAIASTEVDAPDLPVAVFVQEATTLVDLVKQPAVRAKLLATGLAPTLLDALEPAVGALSTAQAQWQNQRDPSKSGALAELEDRGYALRQRLLTAARFNLRTDRKALATIDVIQHGVGVADLTQDLVDVAELLKLSAPAFAADTTFDAEAAASDATSLADELRRAVATTKNATTQAAAGDLRNRAYTYADDVLSHVRAAGRYAYASDRAMASRFASEYVRRRRARARKQNPTPVTPA